MADITDPILALMVLLQLVTLLMVAKRRGVSEPKPAKERKPTKDEVKADEVEHLKAVLGSPEQMSAYAFAKFKGNAKKAKESVQKRLEKLTGEWLEAPFQ